MSDFKRDLEVLINKHSMENGSNTPDFILAQYLQGCLDNFGTVMETRDKWYGINQAEVIDGPVPDSVTKVDPTTLTSLDDFLESEGILDHCTKAALDKLEQEVLKAIENDPNYPLHEPCARKWAIAWRLIRDKNKIDANGGRDNDIDGWMTGWFANAMTSSPDNVGVFSGNSEAVEGAQTLK